MSRVVGSLVEIGISFVPVPGVQPAFDILNLIWQNVQQASNNRGALQNLTISAADILTAINHVLQKNAPDKPVREMLRKLEDFLKEIRIFAEKHANMSLFMQLIKNVDVEGQIEFFQSRLQNLWVAFNIVALGAIGSEVHQIHQGQNVIPQAHSRPQALSPISRTMGSCTPLPLPAISSKKPQPRRQIPQETSKAVVLVAVSSSTPYKIEVRENVPCLISHYHTDEALDYWGLQTMSLQVHKSSNAFKIVQQQGSNLKTWQWTLADSMDISFLKADVAASWFSWLETYASSRAGTIAQRIQYPVASEVVVRKKNNFSKLRNSGTSIDYTRPTADGWVAVLSGHSQSAQDYASQFTYFSTYSYGNLPFCIVYRSGDTLVHERYARADSLEPTISRRYLFESKDLAQTWYTIWKDCAMTNKGEDEPTQLEVVTKYKGEIMSQNDNPIIASAAWPSVKLQNWGTPEFKRTKASVSTRFKWIYDQDRKITVNAVIGSRPDWFENLEIDFPRKQSAAMWFGYLTGYYLPGSRGAGPYQLPTPQKENISITNICIHWMQKNSDIIRIRKATSDSWTNILGKSYKKLEENVSYMSVVGTSSLPIIRIRISGDTLRFDRRRSADEGDPAISAKYKFNTNADAQMWYNIWRGHIREHVASE